MQELKKIIHDLSKFDHSNIQLLVAHLSKLEHDADSTKIDIRNHLPKSLFLAIDRSELLQILEIQDDIADKAEEIGHLLMLQKLAPINELIPILKNFFDKNMEAFMEVYHIMKEMDNLLEASFGGLEAQKVKAMIDQTAYIEYESSLIKQKLMSSFFEQGKELSAPSFFQWMKLIEEVGSISHISDKLAMRIRQLLDIN